MEWSKKMLVFWERCLASGFTVGVILASLLLICFLVSVDNQPITSTSSSPSSFSSLFSFLNPHSSFPNSTTTLPANTSNNTVLERIDGRNETDSWSISSNYSVIEPKFGNNHTEIFNLNNSANAVSNTTLTQENFPLKEPIGGNLGCNNTSTSNVSPCNATESDLGNIINGTNTTQVEESSKNSGNADVISTGTVEISQTNSTTNSSSVISTLSPSSNTSLFPLNVATDRNTSSTIENISVAKPSFKNETNVDKGKNFSHSFIGTNKASLSQEKCDIFDGKWVRDESYPLYPPGSCPYIDDDFNCYKNGRHDHDFLNWRWQPNQCNIPRLNATDFLERLRGKRLLFVGDSLNRNMWESLVCALRHGVSDKSKVFETSGKKRFKTSGYYSFRFKDYKCYVDFVRSTFLVKELYQNNNNIEEEKLRLDMLDETTIAYHKADVIIFNTGHWWTHEKTSKGINYYQEGNYVYPSLKVLNAYQKALTTWAKWVDNNINPSKTQVVFRGYSLTHFKGGQWNSGGQCHKETEPIFNETYLSHYPSKMRALQNVLREMKTPVIYLNISRLTDYRKDAHPSIYRKKYNSIEEQIAAEKSQDCSHWCLPGVPDLWNELLYASLLKTGKGSWRN